MDIRIFQYPWPSCTPTISLDTAGLLNLLVDAEYCSAVDARQSGKMIHTELLRLKQVLYDLSRVV